MTTVVTATKSNNTITVLVNEDGSIKPIPATSEHPKWNDILKAWAEQNYDALLELLSLKRIVEKFSSGDLVVSDNGVFYKDVPLVGIDVDRIMAFLRVGDPYQPIARYMERKLKNPSKRAINEMYNFLEHKQMSLTPRGTFLAYKGVLPDFFSVSSGKEVLLQGRRNEAGQIFNGVGETIEMNRSDVDDDFRRGCSGGLHAGSLEYARDWAKTHKGIIIVIEVDPADVVSVPEECQCKKLRCCKYTVIGLYNGPLPDTYTAEFENTARFAGGEEGDFCSECNESLDNCTCDTCPDCGEDTGFCKCEEDEKETECGCCNANCEHCYPPDKKNDEECPCQTCESQTSPPLVLPKETVREILGLDTKGDELRQKYVATVCEMLNVTPDKVTDDKRFIEDLGADSLDTVELVMMLEEEFGVDIPDEVAEKCLTVGEGIAAIRNLGGMCPCSLDESCTCSEPPTPIAKVSPMDVMSKNLDKVLEEAEQNEQPATTYQKVQEPPVPQNADAKTYAEGFELGLRNGVRRRKRLYQEGNSNALAYERGYCDGYRAGRKDYKQK